MKFSQERLEHFCPTFAQPNDHLFELLKSSLAQAYDHLKSELTHDLQGSWALIERALPERIEAVVYADGCARAVPQLDLIATENGFGVVSNEHVAPASPHRVKALLASLERQAALAWSNLVTEALTVEQWQESMAARHIFDSLIPTPRIAERFLLIGTDERPTTLRDFNYLKPFIQEAQTELARVISPELLRLLTQLQRDCCDFSERRSFAFSLLLERSRGFIAAYINREGTQALGLKAFALSAFLNEHGESVFPEYFQSQTYAALTQSLTHPDNSKSSHAYTF